MNESGQRSSKRAHRLPPCPAYDVEGMESWLTDMAEQGWFLSRDGFFAGVATFESGEPCSIKYRLDAAPRNTSIWSDNGGAPDQEAVALSQKLGWEYVASRGQFHIYRSTEAGARELNTDPLVQALAIDEVRKRERGAVITTLFWMFIYPLILIRGNILLLMLDGGTALVLSAMLLLLWVFAGTLARAIHLGQLRKRLLAAGELDHGKAWRRRSAVYRVGNSLLILLIAIWLGIFLHQWSNAVMDVNKAPLGDYRGEPPFATMTDFAPEGEYQLENYGLANTVEEKSDWLAPVVIDWAEIATIKLSNGTKLSGGLYVDYYETATPWLAREVAREYLRTDKRSKTYLELALPELAADYAVAYTSTLNSPTLIVQSGSKVMRAMFHQTSSTNELSFDDWVRIMAESIK